MTKTCYYWCPLCAEKVPTEDVAHTMPLTHGRCGNSVEAYDPAWDGSDSPAVFVAAGCLAIIVIGIIATVIAAWAHA